MSAKTDWSFSFVLSSPLPSQKNQGSSKSAWEFNDYRNRWRGAMRVTLYYAWCAMQQFRQRNPDLGEWFTHLMPLYGTHPRIRLLSIFYAHWAGNPKLAALRLLRNSRLPQAVNIISTAPLRARMSHFPTETGLQRRDAMPHR